MKKRNLSILAVALLTVGLLQPTLAQATDFEDDLYSPSAKPVVHYKVINANSYLGIQRSQPQYHCHAATGGIHCNINISIAATRTISVGLGATRNIIAAELGWSSAYTHTVGGQCSKYLQKGQTLVAYPYGTFTTYQIKKTVVPKGGSQTSGWLTSFNPTGVACEVR